MMEQQEEKASSQSKVCEREIAEKGWRVMGGEPRRKESESSKSEPCYRCPIALLSVLAAEAEKEG